MWDGSEIAPAGCYEHNGGSVGTWTTSRRTRLMQIDFCFQLGRRSLNETQPTGMALPVLMPTKVPPTVTAPAVQHRIACHHLIAGAKKKNLTSRGNLVAWYKRCIHPGFFMDAYINVPRHSGATLTPDRQLQPPRERPSPHQVRR
jgi:hypothetical protein